MANTITYSQLYESMLQERLDRPQNWKEFCKVDFSNTRTINSSYISDEGAVTTVTRGTAFALTDITETNSALTISTGRDLARYADWGDLAQSPWTIPAEMFSRIGKMLGEFIELDVLAQHASWTNMGDSAGRIALATTAITVSATNVDDIVRAVIREIRIANGQSLMNENKPFLAWRPADFEFVEAFAQANGFESADRALERGLPPQVTYLGAVHYITNDNAANHMFAGVRKIQRLGILRGTFGRAHTIDFPAGSTNNNLSGQAYYSRVDIGHLTPGAHTSILFDINLA